MSPSSNSNLNTLLPTILSSRNLRYQQETPSTASILSTQNKLIPSEFMELYPDIERTLLTSFIEDDYDGKLHMMTLNTNTNTDTDNTNNSDGDIREVVGIAFWREMDDDEMKEWLDLHRVEETLKRHGEDDDERQQEDNIPLQLRQQQFVEQNRPRRVSFRCPSDDRLSTRGKRRMEMIRNDSITWIRNALNTHNNDKDKASNKRNSQPQHNTIISPVNKLIHAWIKIELIAIKTTLPGAMLGGTLWDRGHTCYDFSRQQD